MPAAAVLDMVVGRTLSETLVVWGPAADLQLVGQVVPLPWGVFADFLLESSFDPWPGPAELQLIGLIDLRAVPVDWPLSQPLPADLLLALDP